MFGAIERGSRRIGAGLDRRASRDPTISHFLVPKDREKIEGRMADRRKERRESVNEKMDRAMKESQATIDNTKLLLEVHKKYEILLSASERFDKEEAFRIIGRLENYMQGVNKIRGDISETLRSTPPHSPNESFFDIEHKKLNNLSAITKNVEEICRQEFPRLVELTYEDLRLFPQIYLREIMSLDIESRNRLAKLLLSENEKKQIEELIQDIGKIISKRRFPRLVIKSNITNERINSVMNIIDRKLSRILKEKDEQDGEGNQFF